MVSENVSAAFAALKRKVGFLLSKLPCFHDNTSEGNSRDIIHLLRTVLRKSGQHVKLIASYNKINTKGFIKFCCL